MKLLFLRGQVPYDRPRQQITFDDLASNDDMWTQLAYRLACGLGEGELWFEKGKRVTRYADNFVERWVSRYRETKCAFKPDVLFARGGFGYMLAEARRHPKAFKIYYAAGDHIPQAGQPWDLMLVDAEKQLKKAKSRGYKAVPFYKPAADNVFRPVQREKRYDVLFVANWDPNRQKGWRYMFPEWRRHDYKILHVGVARGGWAKKNPRVTFHGWAPRRELPALYAQSRVAVVYGDRKDSCPRVIPEALACGCPIFISEGTTYWKKQYLNDQTGCEWTKATYHAVLQDMLAHPERFDPAAYYDSCLSLDQSAARLLRVIEGLV